ncbi:MAG: flagellar hook-associated protein FlgK [Planctomycetaceae bacterium]|nr:MAG: flagellar hook-associated protein FlgK [Planctomycetaceae bacterium]
MLSYSIGLSGLNAAQRALELIGTNIANATTEGYHRQQLDLAPVDYTSLGAKTSGGVSVTGIRRLVDNMLEVEITRQQSNLSQSSQELNTLQAIEASLGDLGSSSIGYSLTQFLASMQELTGQPDSLPLRQQMVDAADSLCSQLRSFSEFLTSVQQQVYGQAQEAVSEVNTLSARVAELNTQIMEAKDRGGFPSMLEDNRQQAINDIAELLGIETNTKSAADGAVNVIAQNSPLVMGATAATLAIGITSADTIGLSVNDAGNYQTDWSGGKLGALLRLRNEIIPAIQAQFDSLAQQVMSAVNQIHVQGVGASGSFDSLTGVTCPDGLLSTWATGVSDGEINIRITDSVGGLTRQKVAVNTKVDTLESIAGKIDALTGVSASVVNGALRIQSDSGCTFDFLPEVLKTPDLSGITGSAGPTVSGAYDGKTNDKFVFTVKGSGEVGIDDSLHLEVRNLAGELVESFNIGEGYAAGDKLELPNGIKVSLTAGQLNDGDTFSVEGLANTDTSGFLATAGINTFFVGDSARNISVATRILTDPNKIACSAASSGKDNLNIVKISGMIDKPLEALGNNTLANYFTQIIVGVGQSVADRQARQESTQDVMQNLQQQQNSISGVDINEEAANLMIYQRMYQGMAKFISTQDQTLKYLMDIL